MGGATSKNYLDSSIKASIQSINTVSQHCMTTNQQNINVNINGCGGNVVYKGDVSQAAVLTENCKQSAQVTAKQEADITSTLAQTAEAITQNLSLSPGSADAENMIVSSIELSEIVKNTFQQSCNIASSQTFNLNVSNCPKNGGSAGTLDIAPNITQTMQSILDCVQNSTAVTDQSAKIKLMITQSAVAKQENALWVLVGLLLVFMLPEILAIKYGVGNQNPVVAGLSIIAILALFISVFAVGYIVLAIILKIFGVKWWPFNKAPWDQPDSEKPRQKKTGDAIYKLDYNKAAFNLLLPKIIERYKCHSDSVNSGDSTWTIIRKYVFTDAPSTLTDLEVANKVCEVNMKDYPAFARISGNLDQHFCESDCFFIGNVKPDPEIIPGQWDRCMNQANFVKFVGNKINPKNSDVRPLQSNQSIVSPKKPGDYCINLSNCNAYDSSAPGVYNFYQVVDTRPTKGINSILIPDKNSETNISYTI